MKKVVVWGNGKTWERLKEYFDYNTYEIVAFVDSAPKANSVEIFDMSIPLYSSDVFFSLDLKVDIIAIFSIYEHEIRDSISASGKKYQNVTIYGLEEASKRLLNQCYYLERTLYNKIIEIESSSCKSMHLNAKILEELNRKKEIHSINDVEFRVYSQWGEDGIIAYLTSVIPIPNKMFVEFGVADYKESNTRYLLVDKNWKGLVLDSGKENIEKIQNDDIYWRYGLTAKEAFITPENINELIGSAGYSGDIGLLSVDIDGMDYWVLQAIDVVKPRIIVCEFNPVFGYKDAVTILPDNNFTRFSAHYSGTYFGASVRALQKLAKDKGYTYVGMCSNACNAFFVRDDLTSYLPQEVLNDDNMAECNYRIGMDIDGKCTYMPCSEYIKVLENMEVYDISSEKCKRVSEILI